MASSSSSTPPAIKPEEQAKVDVERLREMIVDSIYDEREARHEADIYSPQGDEVLDWEIKKANPHTAMARSSIKHPHLRKKIPAPPPGQKKDFFGRKVPPKKTPPKETSSPPNPASPPKLTLDTNTDRPNIAEQIVQILMSPRPDYDDMLLNRPRPGREGMSKPDYLDKARKRDCDAAALDIDNIIDDSKRPTKRQKPTPSSTASKRSSDSSSSEQSTPSKKRKVATPNPEFARVTRGSRKQAATDEVINAINAPSTVTPPTTSDSSSSKGQPKTPPARRLPPKWPSGHEPEKSTHEYDTPQTLSSERSTIGMTALPGSIWYERERSQAMTPLSTINPVRKVESVEPTSTNIKGSSEQLIEKVSEHRGGQSSEQATANTTEPLLKKDTEPTTDITTQQSINKATEQITEDTTTQRPSLKLKLKAKKFPEQVVASQPPNTVVAESSSKDVKTEVSGESNIAAPTNTTQTADTEAVNEANGNVEAANDGTEDTTRKTRSSAKGKGKGKAPATETNFQATAGTMGTTLVPPPDASLTAPWHCANRSCNSGQTWHPRDGPGAAFGRKVISNFFGRNKKETNLIHADVWHNYCRKDYQRSTYKVNTQDASAKCGYYVNNVHMQLQRIKLWRPEAMFKVQLSKGAQERLNKYYKELSKNGKNENAAAQGVAKTPGTSTKGKEKPLSLEDAFPIKLLDTFSTQFVTETEAFTYDFDELENVLQWIRDRYEPGEIETMPPFEFLINDQADDEEVIDPTYNYHRWIANEDGEEFVEPDECDDDEE
jgi:hypothetical protein